MNHGSDQQWFSVGKLAGNYFLALECYLTFPHNKEIINLDFYQLTHLLVQQEAICKLVEPVSLLIENGPKAKVILIREILLKLVVCEQNPALAMMADCFRT